ncbi:MAG: TonB-dependent receptor [Anditalea sp.]
MINLRKSILVAVVMMSVQIYVKGQTNDTLPMTKQLEEITVTAQKQEEKLQEIPASVSNITDQEVNNLRLWQVRDLAGIFPNFYSSHSGDGRNVIGIRGIGTTSYDPAVAIYVDGVIQFGLDTYSNGLLDIERIEVLRGPQGTLYGRNAMGGVINIITKKPTNQTKGFVGLDFGNYGLSRYSLGFKTALVPNKLFIGLSGLYEKHGGFYTNEYDGSDYDRRNVLLGNYYVRYLANPYWAFTINFKHSLNRNHGAFPLAGTIEQAVEQPYKLNQNTLTRMVDNVSNASLSADYAGNALNFSSQTSFQSNYRIYEEPIDGDFSPLDIVSIVNNYGKDWNKVSVWTQEFRLSPVKDEQAKFSWLAGLFGFVKNDPVKQGTYFGENADLYGSDPNITLVTTNIGMNKGFALFGQGTYRLSEKLDLMLGMRYDRESRSLTGKKEVIMNKTAPMIIQEDTTAQSTFNALSPKAVLSYKVGTENLLFLSYSRGFRAGGITQVTTDPSQPAFRVFQPEFSNNYELGLKNEFLDRQIRWNLSTFFTTVNNIQVPQLILPDAIVITRNEGKLRSMGIESEFTSLLGNDLTLTWNTGITDAEFTELVMVGEGDNEDLEGNKQLFAPDFTSNLILQYNKAVGASEDFQFSATAEWLWIGTTYFDLQNSLKQDPYHLINARLGIRKGKVELALWARNILDTRYVDYAYNFGAAHLGEPATFGISARVDF